MKRLCLLALLSICPSLFSISFAPNGTPIQIPAGATNQQYPTIVESIPSMTFPVNTMFIVFSADPNSLYYIRRNSTNTGWVPGTAASIVVSSSVDGSTGEIFFPVLNNFLGSTRLWLKTGGTALSAGSNGYYCTVDTDTGAIDGPSPGTFVPLPAGIWGPFNNAPLVIPSTGLGQAFSSTGRLICGSWLQTFNTKTAYVEISDDGGSTWMRSQNINNPNFNPNVESSSVFHDNDGNLNVMMPGSDEAIYRAISYDGGFSWATPFLTGINGNNTGIKSRICVLTWSDGRIFLACTTKDNQNNNTMQLFESTDGGQTFGPPFQVFPYPSGTPSTDTVDYPNMIQENQGGDGFMHMVFKSGGNAIQYAIIDVNS